MMSQLVVAQVKTGSGGGHDREKYGTEIDPSVQEEIARKKKEVAEFLIKFKDQVKNGLSNNETSSEKHKLTVEEILGLIKNKLNQTKKNCHGSEFKTPEEIMEKLPELIIRQKVSDIELVGEVESFRQKCESDNFKFKKVHQSKKCPPDPELSLYLDYLLIVNRSEVIDMLKQNKKSDEQIKEIMEALELFSKINIGP